MEDSDTVANKEALADAFADRNELKKATNLYQACLIGHHEDDIYIRKKLATTFYKAKQYGKAVKEFDRITNISEEPLKPESLLCYVKCLEKLNCPTKTIKAYKQLISRHHGLEGNYRYLLLLKKINKENELAGYLKKVEKKYRDLTPHYRKIEKKWLKKIKKELE